MRTGSYRDGIIDLCLVFRHIRLLEKDNCLLVLKNPAGVLHLYLDQCNVLGAAIQRGVTRRTFQPDKLGTDPLVAYDEPKRMLLLCSASKVVSVLPLLKSLTRLPSSTCIYSLSTRATSNCKRGVTPLTFGLGTIVKALFLSTMHASSAAARKFSSSIASAKPEYFLL